MDVTDEYTAQNLSARQRDVMKLIVDPKKQLNA
jgi:hypothetical protein